RSKTVKSGLCIPVSKVEDMLRKERYTYKYNSLTSIYLTAVLEYVIFELFESAAHITFEEDKKIVTAYHFLKGITHDEVLYQLIG
ncbi:histone-fold-containing protein, partial [Cunninghamella echinulata]